MMTSDTTCGTYSWTSSFDTDLPTGDYRCNYCGAIHTTGYGRATCCTKRYESYKTKVSRAYDVVVRTQPSPKRVMARFSAYVAAGLRPPRMTTQRRGRDPHVPGKWLLRKHSS